MHHIKKCPAGGQGEGVLRFYAQGEEMSKSPLLTKRGTSHQNDSVVFNLGYRSKK